MVVISIIWIPMIQSMQGGQLYIYIQAIAAYLAPPIAAVYLFAVLWKRGNEQVHAWLCIFSVLFLAQYLDWFLKCDIERASQKIRTERRY